MNRAQITGYSRWTRLPLVYLPVRRRGELIGHLWASRGYNAAGFERRLAVAGDDLDCVIAWEARLNGAAARQLGVIRTGFPDNKRRRIDGGAGERQ